MKNGFSLLEALIALALSTIFVFFSLNYLNTLNRDRIAARTVGSRDRILLGVRSLAGMPAALRNSMRASEGATAVNPEFLACTGANPPGQCHSGIIYPLTLYSPILLMVSPGTYAIKAISSPLGSDSPLRFDSFGSPCDETDNLADCPLLVFTSFKAECAPPPVAAIPAGPIAQDSLNLKPADVCTVADRVEVIYSVKMDPALASANPGLSAFITPMEGSVVTSVKAISGNSPQ